MTRREFLLLAAGYTLSLFLKSPVAKAQYGGAPTSSGLEFPVEFPVVFDGNSQTATSTTLLSFRSLTFWERIFGTARSVSY